MGVTVNLVSVSLPNGYLHWHLKGELKCGAFCCKVHPMKHRQGLHDFTIKSVSYSNKGEERWNIVSLAKQLGKILPTSGCEVSPLQGYPQYAVRFL